MLLLFSRHAFTLGLFFFSLFFSCSLFSQEIRTEKPAYSPQEKITIHFSGFPGNPLDWISVVPITYRDDQLFQWKHTNGQRSGTMPFDAMPPGDYEVRSYFNNEYTVRSRYRFTILTTDPDLRVRTTKDVYLPDEKIEVSYEGFPGNKLDWVGVVPSSYSDEQLGEWYHTDGKLSGNLFFKGLPEGTYEARAYFNNEYIVRARYPFVVSRTVKGGSKDICRGPLSVFFAGMSSLGSAWGRTANEPTIMTSVATVDIQNALGSARDGLNIVRDCIPFDLNKLSSLIARMPSLTNVQAEAEIQAIIREIQTLLLSTTSTCDHGATLHALFVAGVHIGAAQAHASAQMCRPAPMPMAFQTVIRNHLITARDNFAVYLPCVPGVMLSQFDSVLLSSMNSVEAHGHIVGLHTNLLWNIALSDCCCHCR